MAKHLTPKDVLTIKDILDGWQDKLTWDLLIDAYFQRTGHKTTRQALSRNVEVSLAFRDKKEFLNTVKPNVTIPSSLKIAGQRIERLTAERDRLRAENDRLLEMFRVWQYNAYKRGLTDIQLNEPLPKIDRRK